LSRPRAVAIAKTSAGGSGTAIDRPSRTAAGPCARKPAAERRCPLLFRW
jgi:hypothetical protein